LPGSGMDPFGSNLIWVYNSKKNMAKKGPNPVGIGVIGKLNPGS
jgi:hypothetical protein